MRSPTLQAEIEAARALIHSASVPAPSRPVLAFPRRGYQLAAAALICAASAAAMLYPAWHRNTKPAAAPQAVLARPNTPAPAVVATVHPAVFFLPALRIRGEQEAAPTLLLSKSATNLEIQVEIRGQTPESVTLRQGNAVIAVENHPSLQTAGPITYLSFRVDPAKLAPGRCLIEIAPQHTAEGHDAESHDQRPFLVRKAS